MRPAEEKLTKSQSDRRDRDRSDRHRSRSPHRSSRGSRREPEVDSYSTSRDYREREREDRYSGRGRDSRRGDDRDRGDRGSGGYERRERREPRRDDDRPPRRERDPFEDRERGRGARGGGRDRDQMGGGGGGGRDRQARSPSPPPKKKEPTPDLTDIVPVTTRKRRLTQWDLKPPGYENVTAEQAKLSGMFPLPGAPRQQAMDPQRLQAFMAQPSGTANNAALKPSNARQSKRLLAHNVPTSVSEDDLVNFLNLQLNGLNVIEGSDPVVSAQFAKDHSFALLEFKNASDATVAMALTGITMSADEEMQNGNGHAADKGLDLRRPKDYIVPSVTDDSDYVEGVVSSIVPDTQNKISVSNIPSYLTDEQVTELLLSFGVLKGFVLVKDTGTDESRVCLSRYIECISANVHTGYCFL
jgi:splicing factor U2AF 65 kDa subunit